MTKEAYEKIAAGLKDAIAHASAPKITPADIEAQIAYEATFRAGHALTALTRMGMEAEGSYMDWKGARPADDRLSLLTIHIIVLHNGFNVVGTSRCLSFETFDAEVGAKLAREDAINQLWPAFGFLALDLMHEAATIAQDANLQRQAAAEPVPGVYSEGQVKHPPHVARMIVEYRELTDRWRKLRDFIYQPNGGVFADLPMEERIAMQSQADAMWTYGEVLLDRLNRAGVGKDELL